MTKFLFDLDGTITRQETLPLIAEHFHVRHKIDRLTADTVAGNVPFVESFIRRVQILGTLPVSEVDALLAKVELYPLLLAFIQAHPRAACVVTGNLFCWIESLMRRIGCPGFASQAQVENDRVAKLLSIVNKEAVVREMQAAGHYVVFVGDGNNDVAAMHLANVAIASGLTHPPADGVLAVADYLALDESDLCIQLNKFL
ncbi:MAG: HAD-IB family phosphatase [Selenomonadaceae bacterium]|nr:HAD-IB family phosphatase [Selenomonadaceae bacterium]